MGEDGWHHFGTFIKVWQAAFWACGWVGLGRVKSRKYKDQIEPCTTGMWRRNPLSSDAGTDTKCQHQMRLLNLPSMSGSDSGTPIELVKSQNYSGYVDFVVSCTT